MPNGSFAALCDRLVDQIEKEDPIVPIEKWTIRYAGIQETWTIKRRMKDNYLLVMDGHFLVQIDSPFFKFDGIFPPNTILINDRSELGKTSWRKETESMIEVFLKGKLLKVETL